MTVASGWMDSMNISASGLTAQRTVMDVIANNIANADTTRTASGGPYRREIVELAPASGGASFSGALQLAMSNGAGGGVEVAGIVQDGSPFPTEYDPTNPDAVNGYVQLPNVNISTEMVDLTTASRAYQANVTAFDAAKQMDLNALALGK